METEKTGDAVQLGGETYRVQPTLLRDVEKMTPMLGPVTDSLRTHGLMLDADGVTKLTEFVYLGVKRGQPPEFTVESLRDQPVTVEELLAAFEVVLRCGLRLKMRKPAEGEAAGA